MSPVENGYAQVINLSLIRIHTQVTPTKKHIFPMGFPVLMDYRCYLLLAMSVFVYCKFHVLHPAVQENIRR